MGKYYIYNANIEDKEYKNATIVFNPYVDFDFSALKNELTEYFRYFHQTSALIFIHCSTVSEPDKQIQTNTEKIFKSIPKAEEDSLKESIFYISYDDLAFKISKKERKG